LTTLPTRGVSTSAFFPRPIEDTLELLAQQPWRGVELMPQAPSECTPEFGERLLHLGNDRFDFCGIHFPQILAPFLYNPYPAAFEYGQRLSRDLVTLAGVLGSRTIVVHGPWPNMATGPFLDATLANLRLMCDLGLERGVTIALENTPSSPMGASPSAMTTFAAQVDRPGLGFTFDVTHTYEMRQEPMPYLRELPSIAHVHASDFDAATNTQHTAPGHGVVDWQVVVRTLAARGFSGNFILELRAASLGEDPVRTLCDSAALLDPIFDDAYGNAPSKREPDAT
jgi:sugar phosphate isomerase/epimerase